jgi:hypothetical protein
MNVGAVIGMRAMGLAAAQANLSHLQSRLTVRVSLQEKSMPQSLAKRLRAAIAAVCAHRSGSDLPDQVFNNFVRTHTALWDEVQSTAGRERVMRLIVICYNTPPAAHDSRQLNFFFD